MKRQRQEVKTIVSRYWKKKQSFNKKPESFKIFLKVITWHEAERVWFLILIRPFKQTTKDIHIVEGFYNKVFLDYNMDELFKVPNILKHYPFQGCISVVFALFDISGIMVANFLDWANYYSINMGSDLGTVARKNPPDVLDSVFSVYKCTSWRRRVSTISFICGNMNHMLLCLFRKHGTSNRAIFNTFRSNINKWVSCLLEKILSFVF